MGSLLNENTNEKSSDKSKPEINHEILKKTAEFIDDKEIKKNYNKNSKNLEITPIKWDDVIFSFPEPKVRFGKGIIEEIPKAIFHLLDPMIMHIKKAVIERPKLMIVIGKSSLKNSGGLNRVLSACERNAIDTLFYSCGSGEATTNMVDEGVQIALDEKPHYIVGIGGGSVLDVAKSIAGIATNGGLVEDYHDGKPFERPGIPFIAVPTTAGTGSEITDNAVIIDKNRGFKKSIRGYQIIAKYILLDPELTLTCPPDVTAYSGADALVQAIEAYVSRYSHPLADIYALEAIKLISKNLKIVYENGSNFTARSEMLLGSFYAGIALSNVKLGLVHGLAHPIGFKYNIPHGKICGVLLPYVIDYNIDYQPRKYTNIARILNQLDLFNKYEPECNDHENAKRLGAMIKELFSQIKIPIKLRDLNILEENFDWIIKNTNGGSVNANPRKIDPISLRELLKKAW